MRARFTYVTAIVLNGKTFYGTTQGFDQLDALENVRWIHPTATKAWIVEPLAEDKDEKTVGE